MKVNQWNVLGGGFLIMGILLGIYNWIVLYPAFSIARMASMEGTSNFEVATSILFWTTNMASFVLLGIGFLFWICAYLESKKK